MAKRTEAKDDPRQRKLGAITPEVVNDLLPARTEVTPTSVAEFDTWDVKRVCAWLTEMAPSFRQARSMVGLGLWVLRDRLATEAEYAAYADPIAEAYDVTPDTLTRWRGAAQEELGLPAPEGAKGKIKAGRLGRAAQSSGENRNESGAPNAPLSGESDEEPEPKTEAEPDSLTPSDQQEQVEPDPESVEERQPSAVVTPASTRNPPSSPQSAPPGVVRKPLEEQVHALPDWPVKPKVA